MSVRIDVESKATLAALKNLEEDVQDRATQVAIMQAGLVLEREAKLMLTKSGRHPKGTPTPSAPGSPPAIVTGSLRASVKTTEPQREGMGNYSVMVGPTVIYARVQELGGGPRNLPARPYMQPAAEQSLGAVREAYINALRRYI